MDGSWQTYFNLGGVAGFLSLLWQVGGAVYKRTRRPRLQFLEFSPKDHVFTVSYPEESLRYVVLNVANKGPKSASVCVARARATPASGGGPVRDVALHWAGITAVSQSTGEGEFPIDIPADCQRRLDVAFTRSHHSGCWLATSSALHGSYYGDAELAQGVEYRVEIWITFEDGNRAKYVLRLTPPQAWDGLNASPG